MSTLYEKRRTRVYVAGPITLGNRCANIRRAVAAASMLLRDGYAPYCPHLTHFQDLMYPEAVETWMQLDFEYLPLCDALVRLPGESIGADREVALALQHNIPVFHNTYDLKKGLGPRILTRPAPACPDAPAQIARSWSVNVKFSTSLLDERNPDTPPSGRRRSWQNYCGRRPIGKTKPPSLGGGRRPPEPQYTGRRTPRTTPEEIASGDWCGGRRTANYGRVARAELPDERKPDNDATLSGRRCQTRNRREGGVFYGGRRADGNLGRAQGRRGKNKGQAARKAEA